VQSLVGIDSAVTDLRRIFTATSAGRSTRGSHAQLLQQPGNLTTHAFDRVAVLLILIVTAFSMYVCMCVCMYVIFITRDKRTSNNKHKKQSQNDLQYKAAKPKKNYKTISLDKAIKIIKNG